MFCPNCGTQNDSAAMPCKKCGFRLSGISTSKFKGTMMLNSDQTVQELIEEHKKKKAEAEAEAEAGSNAGGEPLASEPPAAQPSSKASEGVASVPASRPPVSSVPGTPRPVFQPPRAGTGKRRMGGTMLGVAPQVGGVTPPVASTPALAARQDFDPSQAGVATGSSPSDPPSPASADPLASTLAMPAMAESPSPVTSETFGAEGALARSGSPAPEPDAPDANVNPTAARAPAPTAPLPQQPRDSAPALEEVAPPRTRRVRPFEIALIVLTCGLYGIVVLLRQRKSPVP